MLAVGFMKFVCVFVFKVISPLSVAVIIGR